MPQRLRRGDHREITLSCDDAFRFHGLGRLGEKHGGPRSAAVHSLQIDANRLEKIDSATDCISWERTPIYCELYIVII